MKSKYIIYTITLCLLMFSISGCKKFITIDPPITNSNGAIVYETDPTAIAAVTATYTSMANEDLLGQGFSALNALPGLSADELVLFSGSTNNARIGYYKNALTSQNIRAINFWTGIYPYVYLANVAIERLNTSKGLTVSIKNQLLGEAHFMRAFSYFYLVNLYGDVPLTLSTDYDKASLLPRTAKDQVYIQIVRDLQEAQNLMQDQYYDASLLSTTTERVRPSKSAATALLARAYLYTENWAAAEAEATKLIINTEVYETVGLDAAFLKNSKETIWALQGTGTFATSNTPEGRAFILPSTGPTEDFPYYLNPNLIESFETSDQRLSKWTQRLTVGSAVYDYAFKYKVGQVDAANAEYSIVLRIGEQVLIRAEARAQQGRITGANSAESDLNVIRLRAGLDETTATTKETMLDAILTERRHELFTEWGHRWLDLKRTGKVDAVMTPITADKGGSWNSNWALYPISISELQSAPNLQQTPGY